MANETVEEQILDKLAEMLADITTANGYRQNIYEVNKEDVSVEKIKEFPAINIIIGPIDYRNQSGNAAGRLVKIMTVMLSYFMESPENRPKMRIDGTADLEKRFCDDTVSADPAYNLEGKSLILIPIQCIPFSIDDGKNRFGFDWTAEVHFRQSRKNSTQQY